jgi:hypothetical protein
LLTTLGLFFGQIARWKQSEIDPKWGLGIKSSAQMELFYPWFGLFGKTWVPLLTSLESVYVQIGLGDRCFCWLFLKDGKMIQFVAATDRLMRRIATDFHELICIAWKAL